MPFPVQVLFFLPLLSQKLPHLVQHVLRVRLIKELNNKLQTFDLVFFLSARSSALLELRPGPALLVLICCELQLMQQILKALILYSDSIVSCLVVMPALVYVAQSARTSDGSLSLFLIMILHL